MVPPKRLLLGVALAAVVVTAGCVSGPLSDRQEEQLADRVQSELADVDGYEATVTTTVTVDDETTTTEQRVAADVDDGEVSIETLAPDERRGDEVVSNGSATWHYDASENTVRTYETGGAGTLGNVSAMFDDVADRYNVTVNGTETVRGTEAYVAELTPEDRDAGAMTVWLNTSSYFPVKVEQSYTAGNTSYEATITYENVTLNPGFEDGYFEYEPPADASVESVDLPETEQFGSLNELRDAADRAVETPELPDDFGFESGRLVAGEGEESVTLTYANETASVRVAQRPSAGYDTDGEAVTVDGHEATLSTMGDRVFVTWTCEDTRYSVTTDASESLARSVAASIDC